jgi:mannose-6-phosphate isomerase-like protein (cupin superfamily)
VGTEMYFVMEGELDVVVGDNQIICLLSRGSYFGTYYYDF